eukprot:TRINITY_DN14178_c0_g1_i1.p2 TRINITY_DN14178_c0_g1~~TRINITY_DN14178_c0_g1_i1.p2  ORF type:complete len:174 (+),score=40.74 TRINITY_DN14178_c0_g1_i1:153-674(+)
MSATISSPQSPGGQHRVVFEQVSGPLGNSTPKAPGHAVGSFLGWRVVGDAAGEHAALSSVKATTNQYPITCDAISAAKLSAERVAAKIEALQSRPAPTIAVPNVERKREQQSMRISTELHSMKLLDDVHHLRSSAQPGMYSEHLYRAVQADHWYDHAAATNPDDSLVPFMMRE